MTRNMHLTTDSLSLLRSFDNDKHIFFTGVPRHALHRLPMVCRPYRDLHLSIFNFQFSTFNFNSDPHRFEF